MRSDLWVGLFSIQNLYVDTVFVISALIWDHHTDILAWTRHLVRPWCPSYSCFSISDLSAAGMTSTSWYSTSPSVSGRRALAEYYPCRDGNSDAFGGHPFLMNCTVFCSSSSCSVAEQILWSFCDETGTYACTSWSVCLSPMSVSGHLERAMVTMRCLCLG